MARQNWHTKEIHFKENTWCMLQVLRCCYGLFRINPISVVGIFDDQKLCRHICCVVFDWVHAADVSRTKAMALPLLVHQSGVYWTKMSGSINVAPGSQYRLKSVCSTVGHKIALLLEQDEEVSLFGLRLSILICFSANGHRADRFKCRNTPDHFWPHVRNAKDLIVIARYLISRSIL